MSSVCALEMGNAVSFDGIQCSDPMIMKCQHYNPAPFRSDSRLNSAHAAVDVGDPVFSDHCQRAQIALRICNAHQLQFMILVPEVYLRVIRTQVREQLFFRILGCDLTGKVG